MESHTELDAALEIGGEEMRICLCRDNGRFVVSFSQGNRIAEFDVASPDELKDFLNDIINALKQAEI